MGKIIDEYMDIKLQQEYISKTIDTLWKMVQKYQKIQEIIKDWGNGRCSDAACCLRIKAVVDSLRSVIEDGNT